MYKIALACDHGGYELKEMIAGFLLGMGHDIFDLGTNSTESVDYPEYGHRCAMAVVHGDADLGIVICGTGIGISMAANKVKGARCALCTSVEHFFCKLKRPGVRSNTHSPGEQSPAF